jgi:hypothetical protein
MQRSNGILQVPLARTLRTGPDWWIPQRTATDSQKTGFPSAPAPEFHMHNFVPFVYKGGRIHQGMFRPHTSPDQDLEFLNRAV